MSLKWFHVLFISLSVVLAVGFGLWGIAGDHAVLGGLSILAALALAAYGTYFLQVSRKIGLR